MIRSLKQSSSRAPRKLERDVETSFKDQLTKLHLTQVKLNVIGSTGWPDRLVLLPNGCVVFVELKRHGGKLSPKQKFVHQVLRSLGHAVETFDNADRAVDFVIACREGAKRVTRTTVQ